MVTSHPLPQFGLLVNKGVNVPEAFSREIEAKRPPGSTINLIVQYYL